MSHAATAWAIELIGLTPPQKLVLLLLADAHNGHTGECYPSIDRIADLSSLSRSGVKLAIRGLEAAGLIMREIKSAENGRTLGVQYHLYIGRGQEVTPRGQEVTGEGSGGDPTRGQEVTPNLEKKPGKRTSLATLGTRARRAFFPNATAEAFALFWEAYPNKVGKPYAQKCFEAALAKNVALCDIMDGLRRYVAKTDDRPWCNPSTWLNQERWNDEPAQATRRNGFDAAFDRLNAFLGVGGDDAGAGAPRLSASAIDDPGLPSLRFGRH